MFEELIIAPEERSIFEKYIKLKGVYLHKQVYDIVAPHLKDDEREWLKKYTRAI